MRALFRLMALTTQAIAESKRLSSSHSASDELTGDGATCGTATDALTPSLSPPDSVSTPRLAGVPEKQLEKIFLEKAALEYQLTRKVWNWQQLIHRLGYKIHRGYVVPRRELGVRCFARRDAEESPSDAQGSKNPAARGRDLTESVLRDLSRGFMTLTPEWVAWSTPWASQHLRGYSRLTTTADAPVSAGVSAFPSTAAAPSSGEPAMGPMRGTRRNAFPMIRRTVSRAGAMRVCMVSSITRLGGGVKRALLLTFLR
ncbi:hypothetical protein TRSC58_02093 [Trypanosoma rangeli SC58]|uniref:Uncharacterized protein n=1 Tax=Trypanosoma rangeli SC58 TaxID=429131 RepID=A0A061J415_TRYRA|nr:hypothetical protein TRSC58_02093 [Trypanosoma rangeli SC58]